MQSWAAEELRYADLGDKRLNRRLIDIVENVSSDLQEVERGSEE